MIIIIKEQYSKKNQFHNKVPTLVEIWIVSLWNKDTKNSKRGWATVIA